MAHTPRFKVFDPDGNYIGCAKGADEAVVLARYKGVGATVRDGHASSDTVHTVGRSANLTPHAAAADIYVVIEKRYKARGVEYAAERKRLESQADMRKPFSVYGARSGKKRDLARVQRLTKRDPTK